MDSRLREFIGCPYRTNGRDSNGYDCFGLVLAVYRKLGKKLPDYRRNIDVLENGLKVTRIERPEEYCLVMYDGYSHIGVYLEDGKVMQSLEGFGVVITDVEKLGDIDGYFKADY